ncbi:alpha/beta hydrolase [Clostridium sp. AN503]|uniref:alpha/beta fold hydrolase n=1 Tax=Clostridium sp. AN503 TaxID=3160598 RepID=UPI00345A960D
MLNVIGELEKNKPTVLFLSGGNVSPCVYDQLESDGVFQFAVIDYCRSEPPWDVTSLGKRVAEFIVTAELGQVVLAGWSAGGVISMAAASMHPELISGMLLSNTGPCAKNHGNPDLPKRVLEQWGNRDFFDSLLKGWFSRPVPPLLRLKLLDYMDQVERECAFQITTSVRQVDFREGLKRFHKPVVLAHGSLDKSRTMEHVNMILEAMPQTKVFFMEAGHTSVVESKAEWQEALWALLEQVKMDIL